MTTTVFTQLSSGQLVIDLLKLLGPVNLLVFVHVGGCAGWSTPTTLIQLGCDSALAFTSCFLLPSLSKLRALHARGFLDS